MSIVSGTKKQRKERLLQNLKDGPPSLFSSGSKTITEEEFNHWYKVWAETWIIPEVEDLIKIPEKK